MKIKKNQVENFRLLNNVTMEMEDSSTVIVGRNNSGKTSLAELFRRVISEGATQFQLEDFNLSTHDKYLKAYDLYQQKKDEEEIEEELPSIILRIDFEYDQKAIDIVPLSEFIIDLDVDSNVAIVELSYRLKKGAIKKLFNDISFISDSDKNLQILKKVKENLQSCYGLNLNAIDPTNKDNIKKVDLVKFRTLLKGDFINAQRGLDDVTHKDKNFLGGILEKILSSKGLENATKEDKEAAEGLNRAILEIQEKIDGDFNGSLTELLPALKIFGYPGLSDPNLKTEGSSRFTVGS